MFATSGCENDPHTSLALALVQLREQALLRRLVVAEAVVPAAVPDPARGGMVVADLDYQLGAQRHPLEVAAAGPAAWLGGATLACLQGFEQSTQAAFGLVAEAGDVADGAQLAAVVEAEDQGADGALLLARAPAHHHAVDRALALHLRHPFALAGDVEGVELLGHRSLGAPQPFLRLVGVAGEDARLHGGAIEQPLQPLATLPERNLEQRLVALGEEVEGDEAGGDLLREQRDPRLGRVDT